MTIEIRQEQHGDVRLLALSGRLDTETAADLELALQDLQADGASHFVIDLADIGYVSSAGLRVLLALAKQLDGGRGSLKLCALNEAVRQVFDVAGFSRMFAIFPNRDAALGSATAAATSTPAAPAKPAKPAKPAAAAAPAPPPAPAPAPAPAQARAAAPPAPVSAVAPVPVPAAPAPVPPPKSASAAGDLARHAAGLLGAGEPSADAEPGSAELARTAAELLGGAAKSRSKSAGKARAAEPEPAPQPAPKAEPEAAQSGVLGKFRNLFGGKK